MNIILAIVIFAILLLIVALITLTKKAFKETDKNFSELKILKNEVNKISTLEECEQLHLKCLEMIKITKNPYCVKDIEVIIVFTKGFYKGFNIAKK